jgi:carboxypeptidase family protein/TonB-dependent receptor-like protein
MGRMNRVLSAAGFAAVATAAGTSLALAQQNVPARGPQFRPVSAIIGGAISGIVSDERGGPLPGAMVSALGATMAMTVTDANGRFSLEKLPAGDYTLRAHLAGFAASRRENVRVGLTAPAVYRLQLHRLDTAVATTGHTTDPVTSRPILAAGFGFPSIDAPAATASDDSHSHTETAWRLRHLTRSILKDSANAVVVADDDDSDRAEDPLFGRASRSMGAAAGSFFAALPFTGEVNLLTTGAFAPGDLFSRDMLPRGVAYLTIGAPVAAGNWALRAAMSEGNLSSWIVAGSFVSKREATHSYDFGLSYSTQEYQNANPIALALTDRNRNVGEIYAVDRWTVAPGVAVEYGGRYARYDYLVQPGVFSPRAGLTLEPAPGTRVTAVLAQRMVAPGAEEFLAPAMAGLWLPPERTFSPLTGTNLRVERARDLSVLVEHDFAAYSLGIRRFFQDVDNQAMTIFGMRSPSGARSVGHYYVARAGAVDAQGWGVRLSTLAFKRMSGSVDYSLTHGRWNSFGELPQAKPWLSRLTRAQDEDIHDLTTSFRTSIPETATRVFVLYKLNSGFARRTSTVAETGLEGRFDVQVNQALPFGLGGTKWEVLVGVRNLFRDPNDPGSAYDELLVVRPPKRVVGGFLVRF